MDAGFFTLLSQRVVRHISYWISLLGYEELTCQLEASLDSSGRQSESTIRPHVTALEDTLRSIPDGSLPAENGSDADRLCTYTDAVVQ
jgi:hypothetical protein